MMRRSTLSNVQLNTFSRIYECDMSDGNMLGKGLFSKVYKGQDKQSGLECAVKVIDIEALTDNQFQKIQLEAAICQMISHRNIVQVLSFYKEPLHHYLVYELVTGGELFDEIVARADVGISEQECSAWMKQMFLALKECHDKQIVHRDIKLENLMLESKGPGAQIKLADFGLAVIMKAGKEKLGLAGSPAYVAPEVLRDEPYDSAVDMWSAGIVMYIMLSGTMPFNGDDDDEMFAAIKAGNHTFPSPDWDGIGAAAKSLINELLNMESDFRLDVDGALEHPWIADPANHAAKVKRRASSQRLGRRKSSYIAGEQSKGKRGGGAGAPPKWYGFNLDPESCRFMVLAGGENRFIIRQTPSGFRHIITAYDSGKVINFPIDSTPDGMMRFGFETYTDLEELVQMHYSKPLRGSKGPIYLKYPVKQYIMKGKKLAACKKDVKLCGHGSFLFLKESETSVKLLLHDAGGVKVLKIKFLKAKNVYVLNKLPFQSLDAIMQHISRAPIKGKKGRMLVPQTPALPSRMASSKIVAMV